MRQTTVDSPQYHPVSDMAQIDKKGGLFYELGLSANWWTSTQTSSSTARYRQIDKNGVISGSSNNSREIPA